MQPEAFNQFWGLYPRRIGKLAALKAWQKSIRISTAHEIIEGVKRFAREVRARERQFIPHPSTWLNQGRWMDEPEHNTAEPLPQKGFGPKTFSPSAVDWKSRVNMWRTSNIWMSHWGPQPSEPGCECPAEFLSQQPSLRLVAGGR